MSFSKKCRKSILTGATIRKKYAEFNGAVHFAWKLLVAYTLDNVWFEVLIDYILDNVWFEVLIAYTLDNVWFEVLIDYISDNVWFEVLIAYILDNVIFTKAKYMTLGPKFFCCSKMAVTRRRSKLW